MIPHGNGGEWHNVDFLVPDSLGYAAYRMGAIRHIAAGESLHISHNQCRHPDLCPEDMPFTLLTPEMLLGKGFVEPYPHRFGFTTGYEDSDDQYLIFEVNEPTTVDGVETEVAVNFLLSSGAPNSLQVNFIQAHLKRLGNMNEQVQSRIENELQDPMERSVVQSYFGALLTALRQAYRTARGENLKRIKTSSTESHEKSECFALANSSVAGEEYCQHMYRVGAENGHEAVFDDLQPRPDSLDYGFEVTNCQSRFTDTLLANEAISSFYQTIEFDHFRTAETGKHDSCLMLGDFPQSCTSFRPHYHEIFVHYPASFVKQVKRVLFMGGGDLMILHELLKYPLEVAYGLELDQEVVRQSFRHYGIQPSFDDPRVKWYFGDAAKSVLTIPKELHGTFDVVYVDLMDYVADTVMVSEGVSLLDMAARLVSPDGVIAQNRDFPQQGKPELTKYAVDATFGDIPQFCQEYISVSSNGVNFATAPTFDHHVPTLFYKAGNQEYYGAWTNFHYNPELGGAEMTRMETTKSLGLFIAIEAEECKVSLEDPTALKEIIANSLSTSGLSQVDYTYSTPGEASKARFFDSVLTFVFREGILTLRTQPTLRYAAMDLQLWSDFDVQEILLQRLVDAVGSNLWETASTFRISTGGMFGLSRKTEIPLSPKSVGQPRVRFSDTLSQESTFSKIIRKMMQLSPTSQPETLVLCGDQSSMCSSLDALRHFNSSEASIVPMFACPSLLDDDSTQGDMLACEEEIRDMLQRSFNTIDVMIIDPATPLRMGQVVHKILNQAFITHELLADKFVAMAPMFETGDEEWREALMERFRTDVVVFNPVYLVQSYFEDKLSSLQMHLFSAGDTLFYSRLTKLGAIIQKELTVDFGITGGKSGVTSYIPDFNASMPIFNEDYDVELSLAQWHSQTPVAHQEILQMEIEQHPHPIHEGERVLANFREHPLEGIWAIGTVNSSNPINETHEIVFARREFSKTMERRRLRSLDNSTSILSKGEIVLVRTNINGKERWRQGYIKGINADATYQARIMTLDQDLTIASVPREDLMHQYETKPPLTVSQEMTVAKLEHAVEKAFLASSIKPYLRVVESETVGLGCILLATWKSGNLVVTWDGKMHVDLNLVVDLEAGEASNPVEAFRNALSGLGLGVVGRDIMPRGYGKVVLNPPAASDDTIWFGNFHTSAPNTKLEAVMHN